MDVVNKSELQGYMAKNGHNIKSTAELLGISANTFSRKLHGKADFTIAEANILVKAFGIADPGPVFFAPDVPNPQRAELPDEGVNNYG